MQPDSRNELKVWATALAAICAITSVVAGFQFTRSRWDGIVYVSDLKRFGEATRGPAAVRRDMDLSRLDGEALMAASQRRLLTAARVVTEPGAEAVGVELGQFIIRSMDGHRQLACDYYDRVALLLEADGVAEAGVKPTLEVIASCQSGKDLSLTKPIWIPFQRLSQERPVDMDLNFNDFPESEFRVSGLPDFWPRNWIVTGVRLFKRDEPGREIIVDISDMRDLQMQPLVVRF
ncbi:MAG TPA: hypothetical protein PLZ57_12495 [Pseudobdellovibrionaceae bacterium]|nr:hypothetical protein [Pseudobdellovibrionaceae bacterium]